MHAKTDNAIRYLFDKPPEPGATREVVPGLTWLRLPLPFILNHVNVWILDDGGTGRRAGVTVIDTGADKPDTRAIWERVINEDLKGRRINQLICTHGHPDHVGLAGWLVEKLNIDLHMTLAEWLAPQVWREEGLRPISPDVEAFYRNHGVPDDAIAKIRAVREASPFRNHPLPSNFVRFRDNEMIRFGKRNWKVLVNGGHADEHASFWSKKDGILIAGDQVLSRITPVVGVFPSQPHSDPLSDYLRSLVRLRKLPDDTLVLPSHGLPFRGLHTRLDELAGHHEKRLAQLMDLMKKPTSGCELAHGLFKKAMAEGQTLLALAETLAHAHHLVTKGQAKRIVAKSGNITYVAR